MKTCKPMCEIEKGNQSLVLPNLQSALGGRATGLRRLDGQEDMVRPILCLHRRRTVFLKFSSGVIRLVGQIEQAVGEFLGLSDEQAIGDESVDSARRVYLSRTGWANDRNLW